MPIVDLAPIPLTGEMGMQPVESLENAPAYITGASKDYGMDYSASPQAPAPPSVLGAAFRQDNIIGSVFNRQDIGVSNSAEEGYASSWNNIKGTKYEQHWRSFVDVNNSRMEAARKAQIDMEEDDRRTLAGAGLWGDLASMGMSVFDPTILAPGGGLIKAIRGGYSVSRSALNIGMYAAGGVAAQEAVLQGSQELRPREESAIAVGGGFVLGGLLGAGAAKFLTRAEQRLAERGYRTLSQGLDPDVNRAGATVSAPLADIATRMRAGEDIPTSEAIEAARVAALQARTSDMSPERLARIDDVIEPMVRRLENLASASKADELLTATRTSFGADGARLVDEGGVSIVQSVEDLPARTDGRAHPSDVRGVFDGNKAYLVADNVAPDEVKGVLLHEVGVHFGMERMVGADNFRVLLDDVMARATAGEARFAEAMAAVPKDTPAAHVAEEVLAYLVENAPETGIVQRVIAAVKQFIRQVTGGAYSNLSEAEIRQLAVSSLRKWNPEARPSEIRYARQNRSPEVLRTLPDLVTAAREMASWNDWYERYQGDLKRIFGSDAALIQKMLSATSQATSVPGNVTLALKAYRQFLAGEAFEGYLPAVRGNLESIRNNETLRGQKIAEYGKANEGDADGIAVDRHIAELLFDTKSPTAQQVAAAKGVIRQIAGELGWDAKGVQAALWAYNIVRKGGTPQSYDTFLRAKEAEIQALRTRYGRGEGEGIPDGGPVGGATGGAGAAAEDAGRVSGIAGEAADVRYSRGKRSVESLVAADNGKDAEVAPLARLVDDSRIPWFKIHDHIGATIFPTIADKTAAGAVYKGIDGSELKTKIAMLGGPGFPTMQGNVEAGVVWANRGKGVTSSKAERAKAGQLMAIVMGSNDMHQSNTTVARAAFQTLEAYIRDGRISTENVAKIDDIIREGLSTGVTQAEGFPGLAAGRAVEEWFDKLPFDKRSRFVELLGTAKVENLGGPNLNKILDATRDPNAAGMNWGDVSLIVRLDPDKPKVLLGTEGTLEHPDYPHGVRGEIVGRLKTPINYQELWSPWMEEQGGKLRTDQRQYAFGRVKPAVTITKEMADKLAETQTQAISNTRQAKLAVAFGADRWKQSGVSVKAGGISPQAFVDAINESPASATLSKYTASEVTKLVKSGDMRVFQLGDDGRVWFALKKGDPASEYGLDAKAMGFGDNEVTLTSVVNNEQGVRGIPGEAVLLKAIKEGATALDAFAVSSSRFPNGFLPSYYGKFGFSEVGRTKFDPQYYTANQLADLKKFWKETGWKESDGYPDVAIMKWSGTDADRKSFARSYLGRGADGDAGRASAPDVAGAYEAASDFVGGTAGRGADSVQGPEAGRGGNAGSPVASRLGATLAELKGLSDTALRNFGLTRADIDSLKYSRGGSRNERIAEQLEALSRALATVDDAEAFARTFASRGAVAGAEFTDQPTLQDLTIAGKGARAYAAATKFLNPNLRANFRAVAAAREDMQRLAENSVFQQMHLDNKTLGPSVETQMRAEYRSRIIASAQAADEIWQEARKAGLPMTRRQFDEAVGMAMRREDVGENDFVTRAAQSYRKEMFDHFKVMAQNTRGSDGKPLLPEDLQVVGAPSYLTRMPSQERLVNDEMGFMRTVAGYYEGAFRNEYQKAADATRARLSALDQEITDLKLSPEDRAATMDAIDKRLAEIETTNAREIDLLGQINTLRQQATKAAESGNKKAAKTAREEASRLYAEGGDTLRAFLKERSDLRQRQRRVDLNYAGLQEREDRIMQQLADIDEGNYRAMNRLIDRGMKAEREMVKLDPAQKVEKIAQLREQFAAVVQRSEKSAQRLSDMFRKQAEQEIAAIQKAIKDRQAGGMREALAGTGEAKAEAKSREGSKAISEAINKNAKAEAVRSEQLSRIARRLEEAEALDPDGQILELKRALNELAGQASNTSLGRGEKAQRLMDRAKKLDPKKLDERVEAISAIKRDIEQEFYGRWEVKRSGQGVDLDIANAKPRFNDYAQDVARQIFDHYTGRSETAGTVPDFAVPLATGPLKERTFNIPDQMIEPWLESDITRIAERYGRTMSAQIELTRRFGRADMQDQFTRMSQQYRDLRERVGLANTADEALEIMGQQPGTKDAFDAWRRKEDINKITKERIVQFLTTDEQGATDDLKGVRDLILGRYKMDQNQGDWATISRGLLAFNYIRAMGGAVIANLGDLYRGAMVHGLRRFMGDGLGPLVSNLEGFRASVKEAQLAGQVGEKWLHQRLATFAEIGDHYGKGNAVERLMENASRVASKWNGLQYFTDFSKSLASVMSQARMIDGVMAGKDQKYLRFLGIDGFMEGRIKEQLSAHSRVIDGVRVAETNRWTDEEAVRAYRAALSKDVDSITVERSVGDVPLFANTPTGRLLLQFRTFNMAANQRVLLRGLQEDQARFVGSMVALTSIGIAVSAMRSWRGGEDRWEKFKQSANNPGYLIGEGLDMSGLFTIPFEISNTVEKLTQPSGFSFNPIKTPMMAAFPGRSQQGQSTRFMSRDPLTAVLGPSAGLPMTAARALGGDFKSASQLMPFGTYPGMREAIQAIAGDSPYGF